MKDVAAMLLALKPKEKGDADSHDEDAAPDSEKSDSDYGTELANILRVSDDDKEDFLAALHGYVKQCASEDE